MYQNFDDINSPFPPSKIRTRGEMTCKQTTLFQSNKIFRSPRKRALLFYIHTRGEMGEKTNGCLRSCFSPFHEFGSKFRQSAAFNILFEIKRYYISNVFLKTYMLFLNKYL